MNRILSLLLLTVSFSLFTAKAQDKHKIDSLNNELRKYEIHKKQIGSKATPLMDSTKANILSLLCNEYLTNNSDTGMNYAQQCLTISQKSGYGNGIAIAYYNMGAIDDNRKKYSEAMEYYLKALKIYTELGNKIGTVKIYNSMAEADYYKMDYVHAIEYYKMALKIQIETGNKNGIAEAYSNIGYANADLANFPEALKNYLASVKLYEELGDKWNVGNKYQSIGYIYSQLGNNPEAIKNLLAALKIDEEISEKRSIGYTEENIDWLYREQGNFTLALKYAFAALKAGEELGDKQLIAASYSDIGYIYLDQGNNDEALKKSLIALKFREEAGDKHGILTTYNVIGRAYERQGMLQVALSYETKALSFALEIGDKDIIKLTYEELALINNKLSNYKGAYENEVLFKQYYDTIYNKENEKKLTGLQMQYDFDKIQDSAKADQAKKDLIATNEIKRQKNVRNYTLAGLGIVLLFSIVVFRQRNKISKEKKRSDDLLLNILPEEVAEELKEKGSAEAKMFDDVTVMFTDFKGFTLIAEKLSAKELVGEINYCFSAFDNIIHKYGIEKIKTIGDAYMAVGGLPVANKTHAKDVVNAAMEINKFMEEHKQQRIKEGKEIFEIRIGIHTGPVVAGIVGIKKFAYDIWGDTVNLASRMESSGEAGKVNISGSTYELIKNDFTCTYRGKIRAKNKGEVDMYFVG